jgi:hypothetical protein
MQTQKKANATPGPWSAMRSGRNDAMLGQRGWNPDDPYQCGLRVYGNNRLICTLQDEYGDDAERRAMRAEQEANARLIAAAPELLEGARQVVEWRDLIRQNYPDMAGLIRGMDDLAAAIAKATT